MGIEKFNRSPKDRFEFLSGNLIENVRNIVETLDLPASTRSYFEYVFKDFAIARNKNVVARKSESEVLYKNM
jgi:hypothetical protein